VFLPEIRSKSGWKEVLISGRKTFRRSKYGNLEQATCPFDLSLYLPHVNATLVLEEGLIKA
jgi:hypothetical protein